MFWIGKRYEMILTCGFWRCSIKFICVLCQFPTWVWNVCIEFHDFSCRAFRLNLSLNNISIIAGSVIVVLFVIAASNCPQNTCFESDSNIRVQNVRNFCGCFWPIIDTLVHARSTHGTCWQIWLAQIAKLSAAPDWRDNIFRNADGNIWSYQNKKEK
jgi:hypothetical protein